MDENTGWIFYSDKFRSAMKDAMLQKGVSYSDLGKKLIRSKSGVHAILHGKTNVTVRDFVYICSLLDIDIFQFFDEKEYQLRLL